MDYSLATSYAGESLLSGFNWFDGVDPSHGYVAYQSRANAAARGLYSVDENTGVVRLGVDHTNVYGLGDGRPSIRLESKEAYGDGLFVADFLHMPPSQCGLWPAFWMYGANWPVGGEVDIIEGVNTVHQNTITAHTVDGCFLSPSLMAAASGTMLDTSCAVGSANIGCGYAAPANDMSSYGDGFNAVNGGVYAMQRDSDLIKVWHFMRGEIPADITAKTPNPASWKLPDAVFGGPSCNVDSFFKDMNLVINTNFCGDWGNAVWGKSDQCNNFAPTCNEYVANNPQAFANAYWDVRYIDVYKPSAFRVASAPVSPATSPVPGVPGTGVVSSFVAATGAAQAAANPARVGEYAYLGCFGSGSGFPTFSKVLESGDMTLEMCVGACANSNKTFAGAMETKCFCAGALDADTRATSAEEGGVCDHACPGNGAEVCGGLLDCLPVAATKTTVAASQHFGNATGVPSRRVFRRHVPRDYLLTVYGVVASSESSSKPMPPPMAPQWNTTFTHPVTQTVFRTAYPLQSVPDNVAGGQRPLATDRAGRYCAANDKLSATKIVALQTVPKAGSVGEAAPATNAAVLATGDPKPPGPEATTSQAAVGSTRPLQWQNLSADVPVVAAAPGAAGEGKAVVALRAAALMMVMVL